MYIYVKSWCRMDRDWFGRFNLPCVDNGAYARVLSELICLVSFDVWVAQYPRYNSVLIFKKNNCVTSCKKFPTFINAMCTSFLYTLGLKNADSPVLNSRKKN